jgi:hypothetical protein
MSKSNSVTLRSDPRRFGAILATGVRGDRPLAKHHNTPSALPAKVNIRELVLAAVGEASVFDGFAGEGQLYRRVWHRAKNYVGCDLDWYRDERLLYVADSRRIMRAIDLGRFNVFDFDAYGSPWEHVVILCARRTVRPGERLGLVLTEGSRLKIKFGSLPHALADLASFRRDANAMGLARAQSYNRILDQALLATAARLQCRIARRWQARTVVGSGHITYVGLVLEGVRPRDIRVPADRLATRVRHPR